MNRIVDLGKQYRQKGNSDEQYSRLITDRYGDLGIQDIPNRYHNWDNNTLYLTDSRHKKRLTVQLIYDRQDILNGDKIWNRQYSRHKTANRIT